jgi:PhoH-like ATPase
MVLWTPTKLFNEDKPDHRILNSALLLQKEEKGRKVILVSKDVNLRLKAKALGLQAEDYTTGKIQNISSLHTGQHGCRGSRSFTVINLMYEKGYCPPGEVLGKD